ncbi:sugar-binding domain-containing protein [Agrococcus sp. ARC_14]|uniref:sugar-binding transcriptional regulator n=1 Tax=Agrococcus sp. ARC_14 TaxID=2919927 RepID=UPI001F0591B6|nr:sugar-binding domain-containing protein [Agrococcus sp. ARC_14]MCH1883925.1 transcriptional regulator [Agrococcus sp. ARC_14]
MIEQGKSLRRQGSLVEAARVARRYYLDNKQKNEIAEELGLSRFKVARLLDLARSEGIVQISIQLPTADDLELADRLAARHGLRRAVVVRGEYPDPESIAAAIGHSAAEYLAAILGPEDVLGMAWGASLTAMANAFRAEASGADVVQIVGGVRSVGQTLSGVEIVRRLALRTGGHAYPLHAPFVVGSAEMASDLRQEASLAEVTERFERLTIAVFGVGAWEPPQSSLFNELPHHDRAQLREAGIVADLCGIPLNADGEIVDQAIAQRVVGVSMDELRRVPEAVAVAGGVMKVEAIRACLRAGVISTLVTDSTTAEQLLI